MTGSQKDLSALLCQSEVNESEWSALWIGVRQVSTTVEKGSDAYSVRILVSDGPDSAGDLSICW
jgi:hypothetical protein